MSNEVRASTLFDIHKLTRSYTQIGNKALKGEAEFISGIIFDAVDFPRTITCKGTLIQVYDPRVDGNYWEYENEAKEDSHDVPAGYKVRVVSATIKFT